MNIEKVDNMPKRDEKSLQAKMREMNLDGRLEYIEKNIRGNQDESDKSKTKNKAKDVEMEY